MEKLLMALILTFISTGASAEWTFVGDIDVGHIEKAALHVDKSSIRKTENGARMWVLYDSKNAQGIEGKKFLSGRRLFEFDCVDERERTLTFSLYKWPYG